MTTFRSTNGPIIKNVNDARVRSFSAYDYTILSLSVSLNYVTVLTFVFLLLEIPHDIKHAQ